MNILEYLTKEKQVKEPHPVKEALGDTELNIWHNGWHFMIMGGSIVMGID